MGTLDDVGGLGVCWRQTGELTPGIRMKVAPKRAPCCTRSAVYQRTIFRTTGNVEPVSCEFEPSLWHQNTDIENRAPETGARNSSKGAQNRENSASETRLRLANLRECRDYFCNPDMAHRDGTCWLGWEDSNLRVLHFDPLSIVLKCRRDFQGLRKISAPETHSRTSCKQRAPHPVTSDCRPEWLSGMQDPSMISCAENQQ